MKTSKQLCANCGEREGTIGWTTDGGALALTPGYFGMWCEFCALEAQIEYAQKQAQRLPELRARLAELQGSPSPAAELTWEKVTREDFEALVARLSETERERDELAEALELARSGSYGNLATDG